MEQLSPPHTPETPNGRRDTKGFLSSNSCLGGSCRVPLKKRKHVLADSYREAEAGTPHADTRLAPPPLTYSPNGLSSLNSPPQTPPTETAAYGSKSETNRYVPDHAHPNPNEFSGLKCAPGHESQNCDRADATRRTGAINPENNSRLSLAHEGDRSECVINGEISSSYYVASSTSRSPPLPVQPSCESTLHQEHSSYAYNRMTYEGNATASAYSPDRITYYESITSAYKDYRKVKDDSTSHLHSYRSGLPSDRQYDNYQTAAVEPPRVQVWPKNYQPEIRHAVESKTAVDQQPPSLNATAEYSGAVPSSSSVYPDPRAHGSSQPDKYVSCRPESAPQPYTREDYPSRYRYHSQNSDFNGGSMSSRRSPISTDSHAGFYAESVCRPPSRCYTNLDSGQSNFEASTVAHSHVSPNLSDSLKNFLPSNLLSHEPAAASTSKKPKKTKKYSYFINGKLLDDVASVANSLGKQDSDSNSRVHSKNVAELSEVFNELPSSERVNPDFQASQSHEASEEEYCLMPLAGSSRLPGANQLTGVTGRPCAVNTEQPNAGGPMRKKKPRCSLCLNHGKSVDLKGHKDVCEFKSCICESCIITKQRREAYKIQQNLNRRQDRERLLFDAEDGSSSQ